MVTSKIIHTFLLLAFISKNLIAVSTANCIFSIHARCSPAPLSSTDELTFVDFFIAEEKANTIIYDAMS